MEKYKQYMDNDDYEFVSYSSKEYANGGLVYNNPNAAIEKKEVVRYPDGSTAQANHGTHESGNDAEVNLPDGTQIFSDRLKDPTTKKTFAKMAEKYKIKDVDDKANHLAKSSKELVDQIKQRKLDELFQKQEELKQAKLNKYAQKLGLDTNMFKNGGTKLPKYYNAGIHMDVPEDPQIKFDNFYNSRSNMATAVDGNGQPIFFDNNQVTATDDLTRSALFNRADLPMTVETARESFNYRRPNNQFDNLETIPSIKQTEIPVGKTNTPESLPVPGLHVDTSGDKPNASRKMNPDWIEPATNTLMQNVGNLMYLKDQGKKYDKQDFYKYSPELYNPADALRQADIEARVTRDRLKDASGGNAGALMSNLTQAQAINTMNKSKIRTDASNINNQILNDAQTRNIQGKYSVDDINARNKGQALTNYYKAIQGIGMNTTAAYSDWKRGNMDKNTANMLSSMFSNYGLDMNNPNDWKIFYKKASNKGEE